MKATHRCEICGTDSWGDGRDCTHCRMWRHNISGKPLELGRSFGVKCPAHQDRHMKRTGTQEYACLNTGQVFSLKECLASAQAHPLRETPPNSALARCPGPNKPKGA